MQTYITRPVPAFSAVATALLAQASRKAEGAVAAFQAWRTRQPTEFSYRSRPLLPPVDLNNWGCPFHG